MNPPTLKPLTSIKTPFEDQRFACSECAREFKFAPAYGGYSKRAAYSYLMTRFAKHVERYHHQRR